MSKYILGFKSEERGDATRHRLVLLGFLRLFLLMDADNHHRDSTSDAFFALVCGISS